MMGIEAHGIRQAQDYLASKVEQQRAILLRRLAYAGELAVTAARRALSEAGKPQYKDQTGNLRSSVGYVISDGGRIVAAGGFTAQRGPKAQGGLTGPESGQAFAERLAAQTRGVALVVVAGMEYAKYVEFGNRNARQVAAEGYDVLDSAEIVAKRTIEELMIKLKR